MAGRDVSIKSTKIQKMKNTFRLFAFIVFGALALIGLESFSFIGSNDVVSATQNKTEQIEQQFKARANALAYVGGIDKVNSFVHDLNVLDSLGYAPDTSYTWYVGALRENQILANKLSDRTEVLANKLEYTNRMIDEISKENKRFAVLLDKKKKARSILESQGLALGQ
jgi:hypothetical protein